MASSEAILLSSSAAMVPEMLFIRPRTPRPLLSLWARGRSWLTCEFHFPIQVMDLGGQSQPEEEETGKNGRH